MIPVPFSVQPGDKLRVTTDKPHGSDLMTGDLVTAMNVTLKVVGRVPVPVVIVSTAYGPQQLPFTVVEPVTDLPAYAPAESDDIVDAFFAKILTNALTDDDELRGVFIEAKEKLAANDQKVGQPVQVDGTTVLAEKEQPRQVGPPYVYEDPTGEGELEVVYVEQTCPTHGREGGFYFTINEEDQDAVFISTEAVEPLIKYLFTRRNHSRRPEGQE